MKKLNPSYFEFFFSRYGFIVIGIHVITISLSIYTKEKELFIWVMPSILCFLFLLLVCSTEYRMLRKHLPPADVLLADNSLIINEKSYPSEQIEEITYMPVRHTLNKFTDYFFEITTNDGSVFYFLDKSMGWKGESPTMKILSQHPVFSSKTKEKSESSKGFSVFKKTTQS
ncbi:hypothetical protein [Chryseobacterium sp. PMSZPI]|uniref:hypothetical protein n=1 Tax=Chryseobacterium sp. PMSZPI TaxID=1033900 RepID=UPI000C3449CD|nr:hypothetical protein [Chryseobacterium sp. PMSZPI]PKF73865.1 hypothetical protein CW752_12040 [Chryseobacterium sp. PMSZPI]